MENIKSYVKQVGVDSFAAMAGVHRAQVYRWLSGQNKPRVDVAFRIEDATGGQVPARDWINS